MKKFLITIAVILLGGAGYFTYQHWSSQANLTLWSFISADAGIVIEANLIEDLEPIQNSPLWNIIENTSGLSELNKTLNFLDSINGEGGFSNTFNHIPILIATHKVGNDEVDFLLVSQFQNISQNTFVNSAIQKVSKQGSRIKKRNYNDFTISEIQVGDRQLTYLFHKNFFLASFTPYLVEDAIRVLEDTQIQSFSNGFTKLPKKAGTDKTNLYINFNSFDRLISAFTLTESALPLTFGKYDLSIDSTYIQMTGFSSAQNNWMSTHLGQPMPFEMAEIVPENTAFMQHISSSDMSSWKEKQVQYLRSTDAKIKQYQDSLKALYDFNSDQVFDLIDNEIGMVHLESPRISAPLKMLFLEVKDASDAIDFFSKLTARVATSRGDTVYTEQYSENEIRFLPIAEFPSTLLGEMARGFSQCFYINYRNYLIFSNDLQELKKLIESIENEETWGKSIQMNSFLERTNQAANVSLIVNIPRAWNLILDHLNPGWREYFEKQASSFRSIELGAFQYSYIDGRYFTNYTFTQPEKRSQRIPKTNPENGVQFVSKIITKPFLLRTHTHRDFDMLLQDSTRTVYYLDPKQNAIWSEKLSGKILDGVFPIDYYKNGKIQYLFATSSQVHLIDRTGSYIPGYPKSLPKGATIDHVNLIDYDRSRNYRVAITDTNGNIFLTDKDLKPLTGWDPLRMSRESLQPLQHYRIGRKDLMIATTSSGSISMLNRRGEKMKGFPFETRQQLSRNYFIRPTNDLSTSSITVLSSNGELTELTLEGGLIRKDQLIMSSADTRFNLIPDTGNESFVIVRKSGNTYDVLDDTGNLLFSKDYLSGGPVLIQYYEFGAGKDLITFVDTATNSLYMYDKAGNLVTGNPLNAANQISLIYSRANKEFVVYTTHGVSLEIFKFSY